MNVPEYEIVIDLLCCIYEYMDLKMHMHCFVLLVCVSCVARVAALCAAGKYYNFQNGCVNTVDDAYSVGNGNCATYALGHGTLNHVYCESDCM